MLEARTKISHEVHTKLARLRLATGATLGDILTVMVDKVSPEELIAHVRAKPQRERVEQNRGLTDGILAYLRDHPGAQRAALIDALGTASTNQLGSLVRKGALRTTGKRGQMRYYVNREAK